MGIVSNIKEKLQMYDMIISNLIAGNSIIEPEEKLDNSKIYIDFSSISSEYQLSKFFILQKFPDYIPNQFMDAVRSRCIRPGVKINFYIYSKQHKIFWESAEMKNRMNIWRDYTAQNYSDDVFAYRARRGDILAKERIIWSTKYFNEAELDQKRTLCSVIIVVEIVGTRQGDGILKMSESIKRFRSYCASIDLEYKEMRVNMIDWIKYFGPFSLRNVREVGTKVSRKILTDDVLANFNSYKQGRIGTGGVCMGMDISSKVPILRKFKEDPDAAENWLISAATGGGKSYYVKCLLTYLMADGFVATVMDYEGDEYYNLAKYIRAENPEDVKVISMGRGSTIYFDPMEIAELTGDEDIDADLKENAINYTMSIFRVIACGLDGQLSQWEERIISTAIKRVYDRAGVTNDRETWKRSKGLRIKYVYEEIKRMAIEEEFIDVNMDNIKHKAAVKLHEGASTYFEEGEAKYGTFLHPMSVNELFKAKFIVFSFGMKGATSSQIDPIILALKQLSVANVAIQISNYCKYVRKCFNVKVWEEYQRWGDVKGSSEIISNAMTGGRKRGDVNFIVTNDLRNILDDQNPISVKLKQNITSMIIGKVADKETRKRFCADYSLQELEGVLDRIAKANTDESGKNATNIGNKYKHAFCIIMDNGKKAITKYMLPLELRQSSLFRTGVDVSINE